MKYLRVLGMDKQGKVVMTFPSYKEAVDFIQSHYLKRKSKSSVRQMLFSAFTKRRCFFTREYMFYFENMTPEQTWVEQSLHDGMKLKTPVEEILQLVRDLLKEPFKVHRTLVEGVEVHLTSLRLRTFAVHGAGCVTCGLEGVYFRKVAAMNKAKDKIVYHLNLYGFNKYGKEVMLTKDHVLPKSLGGEDALDNMQTMCLRCNGKKGNKVEGG